MSITVQNYKAEHALCGRLFQAIVIIAPVLMAQDAFAQAVTAPNAIEQMLCNVILTMTGTTGKAIATVGIIGLGAGALYQKVSWNAALLSVLSIGVIFGAAGIMTELGGGGLELIVGAAADTPDYTPDYTPAFSPSSGPVTISLPTPSTDTTSTCSAGTLVSQ